MSRYAGGAFGIDITDFMGQGPDFDGIGAQSLKETAQNFGQQEKINAELAGATQIAQARVEAAKARGKAGVAVAQGAMGNAFASQLSGIIGAIDFGSFGGGGGGGGGEFSQPLGTGYKSPFLSDYQGPGSGDFFPLGK